MRESPADNPRPGPAAAFTLIELIVVMLILGIAAALVIPHMTSFLRGRTLNSEARRMLALTRYGQSRAVAEGVPIFLWINSQNSSYGLIAQTAQADPDDKASTFQADSTLTLQAVEPEGPPSSEDGDERWGAPNNLPCIRFMPDGGFDPASPTKIILRQGAEGALELVPDPNLLGYEILPYTGN